jgi:hypothetical protein
VCSSISGIHSIVQAVLLYLPSVLRISWIQR